MAPHVADLRVGVDNDQLYSRDRRVVLQHLGGYRAAVAGVVCASGGIGTVVGAIVGGLVMGVLNNGMSIMGVSVDWQQAIKGLVLPAAVSFDVYTKNKAHRA